MDKKSLPLVSTETKDMLSVVKRILTLLYIKSIRPTGLPGIWTFWGINFLILTEIWHFISLLPLWMGKYVVILFSVIDFIKLCISQGKGSAGVNVSKAMTAGRKMSNLPATSPAPSNLKGWSRSQRSQWELSHCAVASSGHVHSHLSRAIKILG